MFANPELLNIERPHVQHSVEIFELSRSREVFHTSMRLVGRAALILGMAAGPGVVLGVGESIIAPTRAQAATVFANDYPNQGAMDYNVSNYDWWVDENGNGIADVTPSTTDNDETMSSRDYGYRNCTDGAAYWVNEYTGVNVAGWGNANTWDTSAPSNELIAGNSNSIEPGDIAQSDGGTYGHVGFVTGVTKDSNGTVTSIKTAELNAAGTGLESEPTYSSKNAGGYFTRTGTGYVWNHFIDVNGTGKGLNNEDIGGSAPTNSGVQMILDSVGNVWAMNSINSGSWTQETPSGEAKIAAGSNGLQMILDGSGQVWARNSIGYYVNGGWTQETPAGITAIAAGADGQQMILDSVGQVWAKSSIGYGSWTQETPSGISKIAMGDNGLQMILDSAGKVWAKNSIGYGGWTQETPAGEVAISAGDGGLQMILDGSGQVWARNNIGYYANGGWTQETPSGETQIAAGNNGLQMILDGSGQVWAKNSIGYGQWTQETPAGEIAIAAGDNGQQLILDGLGQVWARNQIGYYGTGGWTQESSGGVTAIAAGS